MNSTYKIDDWRIIEEGFDPANHLKSESVFSLGNGKFGQRANFEEKYSGASMQGTYVAGVYYPDKTRVGWWKNGYPEYFAKVLNAPSWNSIEVMVDGEQLDLNACEVSEFTRVLDMKEGTLSRNFIATLENGAKIQVETLRFISIVDDECACIKYKITNLGEKVQLDLCSFVDGDVHNEDSNYGEQFWDVTEVGESSGVCSVVAQTKKTNFVVGTAMKNSICVCKSPLKGKIDIQDKSVSETYSMSVDGGESLTLYKYVSVTSSLFTEPENVGKKIVSNIDWVSCKTFNKMLEEQKLAWQKKWEQSDIIIEGDSAAQQAIRFNIFHLNQTYTGSDERLNIGPKGFTGEKYGGSTYWDTEAYCLPFYMSTAPEKVGLYLLRYRYKQLDKAIENAQKLGFANGAALYPMVTMNGEECHNEWEITFEEIHRNGAIAYAIYNYTRYTSNNTYLLNEGIHVLMGICRFWAQRVNYSENKEKYVMLGVTGPNEYENNVNNNWYTNYIAKWCFDYTLETIREVQSENQTLFKSYNIGDEELENWEDISLNMYLPFSEKHGVILQNDGFLDKEIIPADEIPVEQRPINQHWSWDRILRSCFIKQADVIQGMYFFHDHFSHDEIVQNFNYYEPLTVHESSLSPCIYSTVASRIGNEAKAYELYLRTARLDLDDYNKEADEGLHITSMAGTWLSIVEGFAGMMVVDDRLSFTNRIPKNWTSLSFRIMYRGANLSVTLNAGSVDVKHLGGKTVELLLGDSVKELQEGGSCTA